jgi:LacI family transcriptional regulator
MTSPDGNGDVQRLPSQRLQRHGVRDVATRAGVSVGTVSNVLNNPGLVAEPTRRRVKAVIDELGFVRNGSARQLRAGKSRSVGAVVLDIGNPFFTEVARGIEDRLNEEDCVLTLCSTDDSIEKESRYLHALEEQRVLGVLITPAEQDIERLLTLHRRGTPVVLLDRHSPTMDLCSVAVDDVRGGELAAGHLLALGHRRIGFVNGPTHIRQCADRQLGVGNAVRAAGFDTAHTIVERVASTLNADGGEEALAELLAMQEPPTAVFCVNDLTALGVLRGLRRRGLAVPDDVAVAGYDDVEFAGMLSRPLTSVRQPKYQLGRAAADLLLAESQEEGAHRHQQILFQPELVVRESSQPARRRPSVRL